MVQSMFRMDNQNFSGTGLGMVANRSIRKGEVILEEGPLVVLDTGLSRADYGNGDAFFEDERLARDSMNRIRNALNRQSLINRQTFRNLYAGTNPEQTGRVRDIDIVELNAFDFDNSSPNNNVCLTILDNISRVNHSCVPNARIADVYNLTPPAPNHLGRLKLIATKTIAADE
jgi:hypothetical protein